MIDLATIPHNQKLAMRACYAHGEQGDWEPDAIKKHLIQSDGLSEAEADEALDGCVQSGLLVLTEPPTADVVPFRPRPRP